MWIITVRTRAQAIAERMRPELARPWADWRNVLASRARTRGVGSFLCARAPRRRAPVNGSWGALCYVSFLGLGCPNRVRRVDNMPLRARRAAAEPPSLLQQRAAASWHAQRGPFTACLRVLGGTCCCVLACVCVWLEVDTQRPTLWRCSNNVAFARSPVVDAPKRSQGQPLQPKRAPNCHALTWSAQL